ncbi:MAG: hypothetical protein IJU44_11965 [Kiritimatiellae bacterium]|nr:hypothetical protein [Kiritimatiellia bacterium]
MRTPVLILLATATLVCAAANEKQIYRRSLDRVASMDPALSSSIYSSRAVNMVYEPLLDVDYYARPYRLIPNLARELPTLSPDRKTYTIRLIDNARFQPDPCFGMDSDGKPQGRPLRAEDVVFSLKRLADAKIASPGSWLVEDSIEGMRLFYEKSKSAEPTDYSLEVSGLTAVDPLTVRIRLTRPMHQFIWYLAMIYSAVVPPEAVQHYGLEFGSHAVGTGPFRLTTWERNHRMVYTRDPEWRGWSNGPHALTGKSDGRPFDQVVFNVMDDVSTQWLCFLAGEIDFLGEISRDNWDVVIDSSGKLSNELAQRGFRLYGVPTMEVAYIGINQEDPVLGKNKKLRQALNCAFDAEAWIRFFNQRVTPCDGPVPPGIPGRLETPFPYASNLDKARQLLKEAGYPGGIDPATGRRLELIIDLGRTSQDVRESTELLVAFYNRIGISLVPQYHNWPTFLRRIAQRQSQMYRIGWIGDYPDAENFLQLFHSKNVSPGPNRTNYVNPDFDREYDAACAATDEDERNRHWMVAQEIIREDCPWIFLNFRKEYTICGPRVKNYIPSDFSHGSERYLRVAQ